jgi:hypothetical protein
MPYPPLFSLKRLSGTLLLLSLTGSPALAGSNQFCGGPATPSDPSDLANVVGDMTLEHSAQQPASMLTCAQGYLLAKCGDFDTANKVFDKCIAAGYVGSMIWKALMLEDGTGTPRDLTEAARLMKQAANSTDPAYAPLGKMHYATMLHIGKGVAKDEQEARRWFEAAAADGNPEAIEFLRSGYHTGERDQSTMGSGTPTAAALARGLTAENASIPSTHRDLAPPRVSSAFAYAKQAIARPQSPAPLAETGIVDALRESAVESGSTEGQRLAPVASATDPTLPGETWWPAVAILLAFLIGTIRQRTTTAPFQSFSGTHA